MFSSKVNHAKNLRDQATEAAEQVRQQVRQQVAPQVVQRLAEARDQLGPALEQAREQLAPRWAEAQEQLGPILEDARQQIDDARIQAAPFLAMAGERLINDVVPTVQSAVQSALEDAREQAGPLVAEARRRGEAAAAAVSGQDDAHSGGGKKKWLALAAVLAGAAVAGKKVMDSGAGTHAAYPAATAPSPMPTAATSGPIGVPPQPGSSAGTADDAAGATPEEALADSSETPHGVTTPDHPAETVRITPESDD
ncbi:MAG: hypothetical protein ACTHNS_05925 [Marmoricola sp.]